MPYSKLVASVIDRRSFDHFARLVRDVLGTSVALVTLIESDRQVFIGSEGLDQRLKDVGQTPISHSLCQLVAASARPLVIVDARSDDRLRDHPAVLELGVGAYAGWPLVDSRGRAVGSLCAIEPHERTWSARDLQLLEHLASACSAELQAMWQQEQESENLLRTIFECVDVAIAFYDTDDRLVTANALAERAAAAAGFSLDSPPYAGDHVYRADNRTGVPLRDQVIPRALRGELDGHEMEWFGPPGRQVALVASTQKVSRTDGTSRGTLVTALDVTRLARSVAVKDEFITTVSHELRTPLTSILGYLEIVLDQVEPGDEAVLSTLSTIERNAHKLEKRVQQLLDTGDRRRRLDLRPTDLREVAVAVAQTLAEEARSAGIELAVLARPGQWATVDRAEVEQALENLVANAIKYNRDGGAVSIDVRRAGCDVEVVVRDDGIGMSPDEVGQACTTFWRSESVVKAAIQGFGIGLTLVRDVVEAHHGRLHITSRPGAGTTVVVSLPASAVASLTPVAHRS